MDRLLPEIIGLELVDGHRRNEFSEIHRSFLICRLVVTSPTILAAEDFAFPPLPLKGRQVPAQGRDDVKRTAFRPSAWTE